MNKFSRLSKRKLATCCEPLQYVATLMLYHFDIGVTSGERPVAEQDFLYLAGASKKRYPNSKHNTSPSKAVDLIIYHPRFGYLTGSKEQIAEIARNLDKTQSHVYTWIIMQYWELNLRMQLEAQKIGHTLRWGGNWNKQDGFLNTKFVDVFHWEIVDARSTG